MPFRNAAPWMEETIQSILKQSVKDWELIAVDDHSTDESQKLIADFKDARIKIIRNDGRGIIPALQTGLKNASGKYITRMDADDLMPQKKLELLRNALLNSNSRTVATGHVRYFSKNGVSKGYVSYQNWLNDRCLKRDHYKHIYRECVIASPNWMTYKEALLEDRIFEQLNYPEDYDMTFHWLRKGYEIITVNEVTHEWREHPTRTSRNSKVYDQVSFFELKLNWFCKMHPEIDTLAIFGADQKGKITVSRLKSIYDIQWYDIDFEKYKTPLMGYPIKDPQTCSVDFALVAVYPKNLEKLEQFLSEKGFVIGKNAWYL